MIFEFKTTTYLEKLSDTLAGLGKHHLHISCDGAWRWDPVPRTSCLHEAIKATVLDDVVRPEVLGDPLNDFGAVR